MRALDGLSGPWRGLSTQAGLRISEAMQLLVENGTILGTGTDIDGQFVVKGRYTADGHVSIVRQYTVTTEPSGDGVGIPYDYEGVWDGMLIAGQWNQRDWAFNGGPFEMWPEREEDLKELAIEMKEIMLTPVSS